MKNYKVLILLSALTLAPVFAAVPVTAAADSLFGDGFETGDYSLWTSGNPEPAVWTTDTTSHAGAQASKVTGDNDETKYLFKNISTAGFNNVVLNYFFRAVDLEEEDVAGIDHDNMTVQWTSDGTNWLDLFQINDTNDSVNLSDPVVWTPETHTLGTAANDNANFAVRFLTKLDDISDSIWLDDISLTGDVIATTTPEVSPTPTPTVAPVVVTQCNDGLDNDGDSWIDFPEAGCDSFSDDDERGAANAAAVSGGNGPIGSSGIAPQIPAQVSGGEVLGVSVGPEAPQIPAQLGTGGPATCNQDSVRTFLRYGDDNNSEEVKKLQLFLNSDLGINLPVTGFFGPQTFEAVKQFQLKYWNEILMPWVGHGLPTSQTPTGYVYKTTLRWINFLECPSKPLPMPEIQ
ncbi:peptidoglycan-binding protein [Candidatus Giovannonibacteria bacterium]|nr:peptidoglycan-binding protein [Candidatus Giovannonibacteria bacterium]